MLGRGEGPLGEEEGAGDGGRRGYRSHWRYREGCGSRTWHELEAGLVRGVSWFCVDVLRRRQSNGRKEMGYGRET